MKRRHLCVLLTCAGLGAVSGCFNLKPTVPQPGYFVLSASAHDEKGDDQRAKQGSHAIGLSPTKLPSYLARKSLAIRKSANEIEYLANALWAENLEQGFTRVLAIDLGSHLAGTTVRRNWHSDDTEFIVEVSVDRFEVDGGGKGELSGKYRIYAVGKNRTLAGEPFSVSQSGRAPGKEAAGAVATLSAMVEELSATLAKAIEAIPRKKLTTES